MFNKFGVNYTGPTSPMEEKPKKEPIVYEREDTTPEIYDDKEIAWTAEKDKLFLEGFYSRSQEIPVAVPEKNFGLSLFLVFLDRCHSLLLPASATGGGRNRPPQILRIDKTKTKPPNPFDFNSMFNTKQTSVSQNKESNSTQNNFDKFEFTTKIDDGIKRDYSKENLRHKLFDKQQRKLVSKVDAVTRRVDRTLGNVARVGTELFAPGTYSNLNIKTYNVNGKKMFFNATGNSAVGVLPTGEVVYGDNANPETVRKAREWAAGDRSSGKDFSIPDITDALNELMKSRAEQYKYINNAPLLEKYDTFKKIVQDDSSGDLKMYPEILEHDLFYYNGEIMQRDDLGNIIYGHLGKKLGIPDILLDIGAGWAQIRDTSETRPKIDFKKVHPTWWVEFFNEPRDARREEQGMRMAERER